jgi:pyrroline-5-carboxylate reductase
MLSGKVVGMIGAGNMGEVLIRGLIQSGKVKKSDIIASDISRHRLDHMSKTYAIRVAASNVEVVEKASIVMIAVKRRTLTTCWMSSPSQAMKGTCLFQSPPASRPTSSLPKCIISPA